MTSGGNRTVNACSLTTGLPWLRPTELRLLAALDGESVPDRVSLASSAHTGGNFGVEL